MKKNAHLKVAIAVAAFVATGWVAPPSAWSGGPGAETRQGLLPLGACSDDGEQLCVDDFDCDGTCATDLSDVVIKAFLTIVSDKDSNLGDVAAIPLTKDAAGNTVPEDFTGTTLTLILEFTYNGENIVIAESYRDLGDSVIPELNIDCAGFCFPGWREPAVESFLVKVSKVGGDGGGPGDGTGGGNQGQRGVRILWATLPEPANTALKEALGLPANAVPFLEMVGERDVFDRSDQDDRLASLHRFKVTIKSAFPLP